jgi:hypothetical protein
MDAVAAYGSDSSEGEEEEEEEQQQGLGEPLQAGRKRPRSPPLSSASPADAISQAVSDMPAVVKEVPTAARQGVLTEPSPVKVPVRPAPAVVPFVAPEEDVEVVHEQEEVVEEEEVKERGGVGLEGAAFLDAAARRELAALGVLEGSGKRARRGANVVSGGSVLHVRDRDVHGEWTADLVTLSTQAPARGAMFDTDRWPSDESLRGRDDGPAARGSGGGGGRHRSHISNVAAEAMKVRAERNYASKVRLAEASLARAGRIPKPHG